ncbi:hypothetical protein [Exiguobacterium acetylicum]|uniref:hypothetical protein n=1 Tax=Exiguobacterium acetylicum TaxID=41170 RepID=UPI001EE1C94E|nr:hypothetical protein [Exiguobacterium acetylicum]UKS54871.1 hypothetical protein K6T22_09930 [Exiguobacterium acetylicum]
MIPIGLQTTLEDRLRMLFANKQFPTPSGETAPVTIHKQRLPEKTSEEDSPFPFIIVKMIEGSGQTEQIQPMSKIGLIVGTFDAFEVSGISSNNGYIDLVQIMNDIEEDLIKRPIIDGKYELELPLKWRINEEDTDPYFIGVLELDFATPNHTRTDVESLL